MYFGFCVKCKNTFESSRLPKNAIKTESTVNNLPIYKGSCICCSPYQDFYTAGYTIEMSKEDTDKAVYKKGINLAIMGDSANKQMFNEEIAI